METWEATLRIVKPVMVKSLLFGIVLEEINDQILDLVEKRSRGHHPSVDNFERQLRVCLIKRFLLKKRLSSAAGCA